MQGKRGQGLSTTAIILIILGVVVLVVLILGFTIGWNKFAPYLSPNNVQTVVNQCSAACATGSIYGFCSESVTLKASDLPGGVKEVQGNCSFFSSNADYAKYGIQSCSSVSCPA